jgi:UDP:flavonoid glycosyltransferase YjiC (YdhE family)
MHILMLAFGTRGDVQPMIALAKGLEQVGHSVRVMAGENFREWLYRQGLDFVPSGIDMQALMSTPAALQWAENSRQYNQTRRMRELVEAFDRSALQSLADGVEGCDAVMGGFVAEGFGQALAEKHGIPYIGALLQPYRPTASGAASLVPIAARRTTRLNRWFGHVADVLIWRVFHEAINELRTDYLGLPAHTAASYRAAMRRVPVVFGFSEHVVPRPRDWDDRLQVSGYWFVDEDDWTPPAGLQAFIEAGPPPVYIGFGSMSASDPQQVFELIRTALHISGQRAVLAGGWGGVVGVSDRIYALDSAPHDWLFPRMAGVVHHGGAGTTAAGLRAGVPSLLIPHLGDQPYWARRLHELGVSPPPIKRRLLTPERLAGGLTRLVADRRLRDNAARLGDLIRAEDGVRVAVEHVHRWLTARR